MPLAHLVELVAAREQAQIKNKRSAMLEAAE
jgi:hypothetical protein